MKLTDAEYQRGLLSWAPSPRAIASVRSMKDGQPDDWSSPLSDPTGSVVPEVLGTPMQLRFGLAEPAADAMPYPARLERLDPDGAVRTRIWDRYDGDEVQLTLAHVPNYGHFHRIVIAPALLFWDEDVIVRSGDVLIRFVNGVVIGEYVPPMNRVEPTAEGFAITGDPVGTKTLSGRFVDIVAPGATVQEAERRARGAYGLVTLLFGDQAIGQVVLENRLEALPRTRQRCLADLAVTGKPGVALPEEAFLHLDELVSRLDRLDSIKKHVELALHWYEQGCRADSRLDRFVAFFIGAETLFKGYVKASGGVEAAKGRKSRYEPALRKAFRGTMEQDVLNSLVNHLGRASQREEFETYASARKLAEDLRSRFPRLSRVRNDIVHGDVSEPDPDDVRDIRRLSTTMLKTELRVPFLVPWEQAIGLESIHLPFDYQEYGWIPFDSSESST